MLSRGRKYLRLALCAALLTGHAAMAGAVTLFTPTITGRTINSLSFSWPGTGPFTAAISTDSTFSTVFATGTVTANTTSYTLLDQDTTYYFRAKVKTDPDTVYQSNHISTSTRVNIPSGLYFSRSKFHAASSATAVAGIGWNVAGNPAWTTYEAQYTSTANYSNASTGTYQTPNSVPVSVGGLTANTPYYFRVRARGVDGTYTGYIYNSTVTLAVDLPSLYAAPSANTAKISWTALNSGALAEKCEGYQVDYSLSESMTSPVTWTTASPDAGYTDLNSLENNTKYFYQAGALNSRGAANLSDVADFITLPVQLSNLTSLGVNAWTATMGWTALPASPQSASAAGYRLQASSTPTFDLGTIISSDTHDITLNSLTVPLDSNTTYYLRAGALNAEDGATYTAAVTTVTLAPALESGLIYLTTSKAQSITVYYTPLPEAPAFVSCEGYRLEASHSPFGSGGPVMSSSTYDSQLGHISVGGLAPNTSYYLRLGTLNWQRNPNYTQLAPFTTTTPGNLANVTLAQVWRSSATITFSPVPEIPDSYVAEASTHQFFSPVMASSRTTDAAANTLTIDGLTPNTYLYFRVGALFNGATDYFNTTPSHGYTLAPQLAGQAISGVYFSSIAVSWTALTADPPAAAYYRLEASTMASFSPVLASSITYSMTQSTLAIPGLEPNTSYYFRVGAFNSEDNGVYAALPATSTLASQPFFKAFNRGINDLTVNWDANSNPDDTRYLVEFAPDSGFSTIAWVLTTNHTANFDALTPNMYYWTRITAINRLDRKTAVTSSSAAATAAIDPLAGTFTDLGISSVTARWTDDENLAGTYYYVEISSSPDFNAPLSSNTLNKSAHFEGLLSNASYYMHVAARNQDGVLTSPAVPLPTALTRPTTPYVAADLAVTFTNFMTDGFVVNWTHNGNSSMTVYEIQLSSKPDLSVMSSSRAAYGEECMFSDLPMGTTYWMKMRARGQTGLFSDFVGTGTATTLANWQANALITQSTTIALGTSYGDISVYIPKGSIGSSTKINMTPLFSPDFTFPPPVSAVATLTPAGTGLAITHFPPTLVLGAITITVPYNPGTLPPGTDASKLILALYDEKNAVWIPLPSVADTANHKVVGQTWHLSTFQIMSAVPQASLGAVKIYPNPYKPNSVSDVVHFTDMPPFARVKIYTFLGELVRSFKADANGMTHWDGLNSDGRKATSGVYIALVQGQDGKSKTFKIALER